MARKENMNHDAILFDMDNTLTRSKSLITPEMFVALAELNKKVPIVVVTGQETKHIFKQIPLIDLLPDAYILSQNGNDAHSARGKRLWREVFSREARDDVLAHINRVATLGYKINPNTLEERGSQISFSLYGHNAPIEEKEKIDPDRSLRQSILKKIPLVSKYTEVKIGGTTCFDYIEKGKTKGLNVRRISNLKGWENPLYIGDALTPGGNDETVIGVCKTRQVSGPPETLSMVREYSSGKPERVVVVSGYFNPLHKGHISMFSSARALGDKLVVILNNDNQVKLKGSTPFMTESERAEVIKSLRDVDEVVIATDSEVVIKGDRREVPISKTLAKIRPHIFANGGDRRTEGEIPEDAVCKKYGIEMVFNVGGEKVQSSSWLLNKITTRD